MHLGHQAILGKTGSLLQGFSDGNLVPCAITFESPPRLFFFPSQEPSLLTTIAEKTFLLKKFGIQKVVFLKFDSKLANTPAKVFFDKFIMEKCRPCAIVIGYNFGFGRGRECDARTLEKMGSLAGIPVTVVPPLCRGNVPVSSGRIRDLLRQGNLKEAGRLLGYPYFFIGKVLRGEGIGKRLGFPTANLSVSEDKISPDGVYAVRVDVLNEKFQTMSHHLGMCNAGWRPTLGKAERPEKKSVEVHLLDFSGNLYGKTLKIDLISKIRDEKKFSSLDALKEQLQHDRVRIKKSLGLKTR